MRCETPTCVGCHKTADQLDECIDGAREISTESAQYTPAEYCAEDEGTYNKSTNTFWCTICYMKAGGPLGKAPALGGPAGPLPDVTPLRQNVDKMFADYVLAATGIDIHAVPKGSPSSAYDRRDESIVVLEAFAQPPLPVHYDDDSDDDEGSP